MNSPIPTPNNAYRSIGIWFWLLVAPLVVVACLLVWQDVFAVFAFYHLTFCLLFPLMENHLGRGFSLGRHLAYLGLTGPGTLRGVLIGSVLGAVMGGGTILAFLGFGEVFLADQNVPAMLARWGVTRENGPLLFWFMALVNGPAEELYWRGFVHTRLQDRLPRRNTILLIAACYAGYHGVTVFLLMGNLAVALLFLGAILAAGLVWGWLREKTGSVWPSLLGHVGASVAYMVLARPLMEL